MIAGASWSDQPALMELVERVIWEDTDGVRFGEACQVKAGGRGARQGAVEERRRWKTVAAQTLNGWGPSSPEIPQMVSRAVPEAPRAYAYGVRITEQSQLGRSIPPARI